MNEYEQRLEDRRERLRGAAERKRAESDSRLRSADEASYAMNGQPILVGHHSEKRHRRELGRMHDNMRKGFRASTWAVDLGRRADGVRRGGGGADAPAAVGGRRGRS